MTSTTKKIKLEDAIHEAGDNLEFKCSKWTYENLVEFLTVDMWDTLKEIRKQRGKTHKEYIVNGEVYEMEKSLFYKLKKDKLGILFAFFDGAMREVKSRVEKEPDLYEPLLKQVKELQRKNKGF